MDNKKKIILLIVVIIIVSLIVWWLTKFSKKISTEAATSSDTTQNIDKTVQDNKDLKPTADIDYLKTAEKMAAKPEKGEEIAILTVKNFGEIKLKFFPNVAPKAVKNFITHAKNGYYNGLTFHRVINNFMIQGGDPSGNGTGGESIWGEGFEKEVDEAYFPYRGTLAMASSSAPKSLGSQFFITQAPYSANQITNMPQSLADAYAKYGGYPSLHKLYTVFGFAYEGMDIVDKIAEVKTDQFDKPEIPVVIEKIEITQAD